MIHNTTRVWELQWHSTCWWWNSVPSAASERVSLRKLRRNQPTDTTEVSSG